MPHAQATAVASGLWGLGIRPGEPVALLVSNRPEWLTTALGCALIGAPVVALSTWSRRVELEYALDHSQAVALVTLDGSGPITRRCSARLSLKPRGVRPGRSMLRDCRPCAS